MSDIIELRSLEINDRFYHASMMGKMPTIYIVWSANQFNAKRGTATRVCIDTRKGIYCNKQSNLKVIKSVTNQK